MRGVAEKCPAKRDPPSEEKRRNPMILLRGKAKSCTCLHKYGIGYVPQLSASVASGYQLAQSRISPKSDNIPSSHRGQTGSPPIYPRASLFGDWRDRQPSTAVFCYKKTTD